jgi:hypothetical protein
MSMQTSQKCSLKVVVSPFVYLGLVYALVLHLGSTAFRRLSSQAADVPCQFLTFLFPLQVVRSRLYVSSLWLR